MKGYAHKNNSHNLKDELQSDFCFFTALRKMSEVLPLEYNPNARRWFNWKRYFVCWSFTERNL